MFIINVLGKQRSCGVVCEFQINFLYLACIWSIEILLSVVKFFEILMLLYHGMIRWEPNICFDLVEIEILHSEIRVWTKIWHWSFVQENRAQKSAEGDEMCFIWIFSFFFGMRYYSMCLYKSMPCVIFEIRVFYKHIIFLWTLKGVFGRS